MRNAMAINDVLKAIGRRDGIPGLSLDSQGCAGVRLRDGVSIFFEWLDDAQLLYLYTPMEIPKGASREEWFGELLRLNCLSTGVTSALHPERQEVVIQLPVAAPTSHSVETVDRAIDQLTAGRNALAAHLHTKA